VMNCGRQPGGVGTLLAEAIGGPGTSDHYSALVKRARRPKAEGDASVVRNVRLWHKADIDFDTEHVCFRAQSGHP